MCKCNSLYHTVGCLDNYVNYKKLNLYRNHHYIVHTNKNIANTCKQANTHRTHTCARRHRHTHLHTHTHTRIHMRHTNTNAHTHTRTLTHISTHTVTSIHARTHTPHTYTHH